MGFAGAGHRTMQRIESPRYAWPSGRWGSLPIAGGAMAAFRRKLKRQPNSKNQIEKRLADIVSPIGTPNHFSLMGVEEVIDPQEYKIPYLCEFASGAGSQCSTLLGPKTRE